MEIRTETLGPHHPATKYSHECLSEVDRIQHGGAELQINDVGLPEITIDVLLKAAEGSDIGVLACLLRLAQGNPPLCPEVVEALAGNEDVEEEVMTFLLDEYGGEVEVTTDVLDAVFRSLENGTAIMKRFLEKRDGGIKVTTELLERAAASHRAGMTALLLERAKTTSRLPRR